VVRAIWMTKLPIPGAELVSNDFAAKCFYTTFADNIG